jgi:hypothetical protein
MLRPDILLERTCHLIADEVEFPLSLSSSDRRMKR